MNCSRKEDMLKLLIKNCRDPGMWYSDKVGQHVPYLGKYPECYKSREDAGYTNIVFVEDAELVEVNDGLV